jgi:hypothetical protein
MTNRVHITSKEKGRLPGVDPLATCLFDSELYVIVLRFVWIIMIFFRVSI